MCAVAVAVLVTYDKVLVEFMHQRRQDQLVSQFNAPPSSSNLAFGDAIAVLQIPSIGVNTIIGEGASHATMRAGPARRVDSAFLGTLGNAVIAGKAFRYGAPFARIDRLTQGSEIFVKLRTAEPVLYIVDEVVTSGEGSDAVVEVAPDRATLTLVTSSSRFGGDDVLVRASLAEGTQLLEAPTVGLAAPRDSVSFTDLAVVAVWLAACVALTLLLRRAKAARPIAVLAVIFVPLSALALLQLALALERLVPATV